MHKAMTHITVTEMTNTIAGLLKILQTIAELSTLILSQFKQMQKLNTVNFPSFSNTQEKKWRFEVPYHN